VTNEKVDSFGKAHAALILHMEDNQLIFVISLEWTREVWVAQTVIHHTSDMSSKLNVKETFNSFNYESTNMKEHLTKFQHIVVKLHAAGCTLSENDPVARFLYSLPNNYDPLVQAISLYVSEVSL
jgi:hypothetical protein